MITTTISMPLVTLFYTHTATGSFLIWRTLATMGSIDGLGERVLTQFDTLVQRGEIIWQDSAPRYIEATPFDVPAHQDLASDLLELMWATVQIPRR
jgi:hypothetical protein